jgi:two-component system, OmpR family, KDP operon response regulator KdpE
MYKNIAIATPCQGNKLLTKRGPLMPSRILVVDDELSIRTLLARVLSREGFEVALAATGREGLELTLRQKPDLVILDLNLPDLDGEEVCRKIRENPLIGNTPVLILTGKSTQGLSVRCLNGGADNYLSKPFDIEDMTAHIRALLRRAQGSIGSQTVITKGRLSMRIPERMIFWNGRKVQTLAPKEFAILRYLVMESPKVIEKNELALKAWGSPADQLHKRTLDVHVRRIRKKLGAIAAPSLKTIPVVGFQWLDEPSVPDKPR